MKWRFNFIKLPFRFLTRLAGQVPAQVTFIMNNLRRVRISIYGAVQGVGFRPFIWRLAEEMSVSGWVRNTAGGVLIEAQASAQIISDFIAAIKDKRPRNSFIQNLECVFLDTEDYEGFKILESEQGDISALIMPDIATCEKCRREILDPESRRYLYPFTNCTNCGPRYSILKKLPYDRSNTTMSGFEMCEDCRREYEDPANRRFHAQPNACAACGPYLELWDAQKNVLSQRNEALEAAAEAVAGGKIVALKGIGGFQFIADATNNGAVNLLRRRKKRGPKPFAVMYASLEDARQDCEINIKEADALSSLQAPIVLLKKKDTAVTAPDIAPSNPYLGVMLAYTPLHILLLNILKRPVVATSGNLSEEPICIDEEEAALSLADIADLFLVHNRPVARHVDDSIVRIVAGREFMLRRARGYAPLPVFMKTEMRSALAVGGHLKNTVALSKGRNIFLSQHIGDLETEKAFKAFEDVIEDLSSVYDIKPQVVAADAHPYYLSTNYAERTGKDVVKVQHHHAHILSAMAENELDEEVLGVSFDGTGYGEDGTVWGGEFLKVSSGGFKRFAFFSPFPLIGGETAVRQPRRVALGLLYSRIGKTIFDKKSLASIRAFSQEELANLKKMLDSGINCPVTSSCGRLFDAVSSMLGICQFMQFEGEAAMGLEFAAEDLQTEDFYGFEIKKIEENFEITAPDMQELLSDIESGTGSGIISAKFHNTLVEVIIGVSKKSGIEKVVLSGGCFQNKYLMERSVKRLNSEGFKPYWHQRIPPNDGGIALGQIIAAQS